jgi:hypothetical protein
MESQDMQAEVEITAATEQPDVQLAKEVPGPAADKAKQSSLWSFLKPGAKRTTSQRSPDKAATGGKADGKRLPMKGKLSDSGRGTVTAESRAEIQYYFSTTATCCQDMPVCSIPFKI